VYTPVLNIELVALGGVNSATIKPREVFRAAIQKNAVQVILAHNHPSGSVVPSEDDEDITDCLIHAGRVVHIDVIDHLIITEKDHFSFLSTGLFKVLEKSKRYAVRIVEEDYFFTKGEKKGLEKGRVEGELIGQIMLCQKLLHTDSYTKKTLQAQSLEHLEAILTELEKQLNL